MDRVVNTPLGKIVIAKEVISTVAGIASIDTYGLVGMASTTLKDGIGELLRFENISRGVEVDVTEDEINVKLYIIVGYGTKISTVARNVISSVRYLLKEKLGIDVNRVDIIVQGVRVNNE